MEKVTIDNVYYELNAKNRTAVIVKGKCEGNIVIPDNITHRDIVYIIKGVGESAFYNTRTKFTKTEDSKMQMIISPISPITSIALPQSITHIEKYAFSNCTHLTSIIIPQGVTFIGEQAFEFCSLKSITLPSSISEIEDYTFQMCSSLTEVLIPNGVTRIGNGAFTGCSSLTSIIIPETVTEIGESAFEDCSSLTSITIPKNVTYIGKNAFRGCISITSIIVDKDNPRYDSRNNCNAIIWKNTLKLGCQNSFIPQGVTSIADGAFEDCTSLESINIPDSVTHIGQKAFYNTGIYNNNSNWSKGFLYIDKCLIAVKEIKQRNLHSNLQFEHYPTQCIVNEGTLVIGDYAFKECEHLVDITLPKSIITIGNHAFDGCITLRIINIPDGIQHIGFCAFNKTELYSDDSNWDKDVLYINQCLIKARPSIVECVIRDNTVLIANGAFTSSWPQDSSLVSVTIPNSVYSIGSSAFYECKSLTAINIPNSITTIEDDTFAGCYSLNSVTIPNSVTYIGRGAFSRCGISKLTLPNSITIIQSGAFKMCSLLTSINIPNSVKYIGSSAFFRCKALDSIVLPNSINHLGGHMFQECDALKSVTIPNNITSIKEYAFHNCTSLESVLIPDSVSNIEDYAFCNCSSLSTIELSKNITHLGIDVLMACTSIQTIKIPRGKKETYCKLGLEKYSNFIYEVEDCVEVEYSAQQEEYTILLNIAKGYELGIGVMKNLAQAVLCYSQAAEKGCAEAAYHLGELYETGKGLPLNYSLAIDWYTKAANLSHPDALNRKQYCQQQLLNEQ